MAKGKDTRDRILSAAKRIMADKGYVGAGVDEIMHNANVGKSSFYHFFPSKAALGEAVLDIYVQKLKSELISEVFQSKVRAKERIPVFLLKLSERLSSSKEDMLLLTWSVEAPFLHEELRTKFLDVLNALRKEFERSLREAVHEYDLFPGAPIQELAEMVLSYILGLFVLCRTGNSPSLLREKARGVTKLWKEYALDDKPPQRDL